MTDAPNRRLPRVRIWIAATLLATVLGLTATAAGADASPSRPHHGDRVGQLLQAWAATAKFHSVKIARKAGYEPVGPCVQTPAGALGIPYGNFALVNDGRVDPRRPEALLYEPRSNGSLRLVGVEYILIDRDQDQTTDDDRPTLFGHAFDGPTAEPQAGLPVHYDLEVWLWRHNPDGLFATFNRNVHCPTP
jgi:hypothetical protein